jgi:hypothetical protein
VIAHSPSPNSGLGGRIAKFDLLKTLDRAGCVFVIVVEVFEPSIFVSVLMVVVVVVVVAFEFKGGPGSDGWFVTGTMYDSTSGESEEFGKEDDNIPHEPWSTWISSPDALAMMLPMWSRHSEDLHGFVLESWAGEVKEMVRILTIIRDAWHVCLIHVSWMLRIMKRTRQERYLTR